MEISCGNEKISNFRINKKAQAVKKRRMTCTCHPPILITTAYKKSAEKANDFNRWMNW